MTVRLSSICLVGEWRNRTADTVRPKIVLVLVAMVLAGFAGRVAWPAEPGAAIDAAAVLRGLDKVTARISTFDAPIDEVIRFGTLAIRARRCHKRPPEEPPEISAFLEIADVREDAEPMALFNGWMFASSPALSALEHPVYDVWVIDCRTSLPSKPEGKE